MDAIKIIIKKRNLCIILVLLLRMRIHIPYIKNMRKNYIIKRLNNVIKISHL